MKTSHHDNVCECSTRALIHELVEEVEVTPGAKCVGPSHRDEVGRLAVRPQIINYSLSQRHRAMLNIFLFCDLQ